MTEYPKMDKTAELPKDAQPYPQEPCPRPQDGKIILAMDDDGNIFNMGTSPMLYMVDDPTVEED